MSKIKTVILNHFRNFNYVDISFNNKTNVFFGNNGSGKTNILESISLLSKGRGIRNSQIENLIQKNKKSFLIKSKLEADNNFIDIEIFSNSIENKHKKKITVNGDSSKESIDFLYASLSYLSFLPEMERLFQSSPTYRRNFIDRLIFSGNNNYNKLINKYKKNILERSKILLESQFDQTWISSIENQISEIGLEIYKLRKNQLNTLNEIIKKLNQTNNFEFDIFLNIKDDFFNLDLNKDIYLSKLFENRNYDKKFGGSKIGPHKTDITATINNNFDASQLSTGQQKTVVLIILLSQCYNLIKFKKIKPIMLLDEICSHLDLNNRKILLDMIDQFDIQFFLSGTDKKLFSFISTNVQFYNITDI